MAHLQTHGSDQHSIMNSGQIQDGTLYPNHYDGYHQNQADQQHMMHVQQNEISQVNDWTSNYQVMSGQGSGAEMLGQMDDNSKMVYNVHHVHQIMPHQQQCDMNDQWYGHQNQPIQQSGPMIENSYMQNTQGQMMMMSSYHHQNSSMQQANHSQQSHLMQHNQGMMQQVMMSNPQQNLSLSMGHQISHQETVQSLNVGNAAYHRKTGVNKSSAKKVMSSRHRKKPKQEEELDWKVPTGNASEDDLFSSDEEDDSNEVDSENEEKNNGFNKPRPKSSKIVKKQSDKKAANKQKMEKVSNMTPLDENAKEVAIKFNSGCECVDQNCFEGFDPVLVSRHRLNIAELSKLEHDMYLMGVAMTCLDNSEETNRQTERQRTRIKYRFMGRKVCQSSFLYLHNSTLHQLKSIRKHVKISGVSARTHGNHRKRAHNTFSLDTYQDATRFVNSYLDSKDAIKRKGNKQSISTSLNCKKIHTEYLAFASINMPDSKPLGYSTFRQFIRVQFQNQFPISKSSISKG